MNGGAHKKNWEINFMVFKFLPHVEENVGDGLLELVILVGSLTISVDIKSI